MFKQTATTKITHTGRAVMRAKGPVKTRWSLDLPSGELVLFATYILAVSVMGALYLWG